MIWVRLQGGLGNQMFQWAFARSLSVKTGVECKVDLSFLNRKDLGPNFTYRNYDLDVFALEASSQNAAPGALQLQEPHFHYAPTLVDAAIRAVRRGSVLLDGYWQSPRYNLGLDEIIRKDFQFKKPIGDSRDARMQHLREEIVSSHSVMVNIRRTDYLNNKLHGVLGQAYIQAAARIMQARVPHPKFFVFSDDIPWCRDHIRLADMVIVDHSCKGNKFGDYLQLMKLCKHFIIPNSTFAWWSAWLNEDDSKIVIAPKQWFLDDKVITSDLIPSAWIRI